MKSIAYSFIGLFFALVSATQVQAGCQSMMGVDGLRLQAANSGPAAMLTFPNLGADGKRISVSVQDWKLAVDRSGNDVTVRFIGEGQSIEIFEGTLEENKGGSSIYRLRLDPRVGQAQVTVCDGQGPATTGPLLNQTVTAKIVLNISDLRSRLLLDYERRFKPGAIASTGTASQVNTTVTFQRQ